MRIEKVKIKECEAFEKVINIKLFNEVIYFIMGTTNVKYEHILQSLQKNNILFKINSNSNIQEEYNFKYLGEMLERYEERIGKKIEDIRAIALAVSYCKDLVIKEMIVGNQLVNFINKIKVMCDNDIYLRGALYLYDRNKYHHLFDEIVLFKKFKTTEDIIFVLSLFNDINEGFERLSESLKRFLGINKTISVMENAKIYDWLIKNLYPIIKNNRKKEFELIKAIVAIPSCFVKEDSKIYNVLIENGYTKEEIAFLNYKLIFYQSIPDCVRVGKSIVEEKIVINFCKVILNSKNFYTDDIYELVKSLLEDYRKFDIKCYGYEGIKNAILELVNIENPKVFVKFYEELNCKVHSFDILDEKWNDLYKKLDIEKYIILFDNYILNNNYNTNQIKERIEKYNNETGTSYIDSFDKYVWNRQKIFNELVDKGIIDLKEYFIKYNKYKEKDKLYYLKYYVEGIGTRKAFLFLKYFFNLEEIKIDDIEKVGFNFDIFIYRERYSYGYYSSVKTLKIQRDFLSFEEHRELLMWLESYIFKSEPDMYIDFIKAILFDEFVEKLFSKKELEQIYFTIIKFDTKCYENKRLREKYLSKEQLEILEKKEKEIEEKQKLKEYLELKNKIIENFNSIEKISLKNVYEFCNKYWRSEELEIAYTLTMKLLEEKIQSYDLSIEEIEYFNKICKLLLKENILEIDKWKEIVERYIWKGKNIYGRNIRTYKISRRIKTK